MSLRSRLARLERDHPALVGPCRRPRPTVLLQGDEPIPPGAAVCAACGQVHPVWIVEEIIDRPVESSAM